jgi:hypothetical protein
MLFERFSTFLQKSSSGLSSPVPDPGSLFCWKRLLFNVLQAVAGD